MVYWCGGSAEEQRASDAQLRACVAATGRPTFAAVMYGITRVVDHPEGDLVAGGDAELDQPLGDGVDAGAELGEGPALSLEGEGLARAPLERRALRQESDRVSVAPVSHDGLLARARGRS